MGGEDKGLTLPLQPDDPLKVAEGVGIVFEIITAVAVKAHLLGGGVHGAVVKGSAEGAHPAVGKGDDCGFTLLGDEQPLHPGKVMPAEAALRKLHEGKGFAVQHQ